MTSLSILGFFSYNIDYVSAKSFHWGLCSAVYCWVLNKVSELKPLEVPLSHGSLTWTIVIAFNKCNKIGTQCGAPVMKVVVNNIWKTNHRVKTDSRIDPNCFDKWWRELEWGHLQLFKWGVRIIPIPLIQMRTPISLAFSLDPYYANRLEMVFER